MKNLEAVAKLLEIAKTNTLIKSSYRDANGNCCIIGHFLTTDELDRLASHGEGAMMESRVMHVAKFLGISLEERIGLPMDDLRHLQRLNDSNTLDLKTELQKILDDARYDKGATS